MDRTTRLLSTGRQTRSANARSSLAGGGFCELRIYEVRYEQGEVAQDSIDMGVPVVRVV